MNRTTLILHAGNWDDNMKKTLLSIAGQTEQNFDLILAGDEDKDISAFLKSRNLKFEWIPSDGKSYPVIMNEAIAKYGNDFVLYMDNRENGIVLKKAMLQSALMAAKRTPDAGMWYFDYELESDAGLKEVHLLFHHIGRVRDNQDYGKVFFFRKKALDDAGGFDTGLKYMHLYDLRLKISEKYKLIRISNKYAGSFYTVMADKKQANVFDYLMAGKDVQLEAEEVFTNHLKRIDAYLKPGVYMPSKGVPKGGYPLKASVVIPVRNRPEFISTAIESVLSQTVPDIEVIIVVNGGEDDPTIEVVRRYMQGGELYDENKPAVRLIVIDINNIGLCLNIGIENARGKYYVQLDSDDRLKPNAVESILKKFDENPNAGMVIGSYEVWEKKQDGTLVRMEEIPVVTHDEWTEDNGRNNLLRINGAGAPRSLPVDVIKEMGYFSVNDDPYARNYGEDYEMVLKVSEHYKVERIFEPIYEVVRHPGGTDHAISEEVTQRNDEAKDYMRKEAILRRIAFNRGSKK